MKKWLLYGCLLLIGFKVNGQQYAQDVVFLAKEVQKLPSYKEQFKEAIKIDLTETDPKTDFDKFLQLYAIISPLRDNHLAFYSHRDSALAKPAIMEIPKVRIDSALEKIDPTDSVTGRYYADKYEMLMLKIGQQYIGVIENQGRYYTQFLLNAVTPNHYDMIGFVKNGGGYFLNRNMVFINQRLSGTPWKKYKQADFVDLPTTTPKFDYKELAPTIAYLRLGNFSANPSNITESEQFFEKLETQVPTKHLIVDLRNNPGGGYKTSKKFLDYLKRYQGQIHLLVNNSTISNAEQLTIDLMNDANVTIYGESTRGTICYGSNYGNTMILPSHKFVLYPTDMKSRKQDLPFESIGISPKVKLDPFSKDWVAQVLDHINRN